MGRAPKGEYAGKSKVFSTRIRPDLRKKLDQAAKQSGRSVSQEVENRLRRSFTEDERISEAFGDRQTYSLLRMVALAIHLDRQWQIDEGGNVLGSSSPDWLKDPERFETAIAATLKIFEAARPFGPIDYNPALQQLLEQRGARAAFEIWRKTQKADAALPLDKGSRADHRFATLKTDLSGLPGTQFDQEKD